MTRTYEARYVLEGDAARAPLGATVTVYLTGTDQAAASAVPIGAITDDGKGPGVWVLDGSTSSVSFRPVRIAEFGGETAFSAAVSGSAKRSWRLAATSSTKASASAPSTIRSP